MLLSPSRLPSARGQFSSLVLLVALMTAATTLVVLEGGPGSWRGPGGAEAGDGDGDGPLFDEGMVIEKPARNILVSLNPQQAIQMLVSIIHFVRLRFSHPLYL